MSIKLVIGIRLTIEDFFRRGAVILSKFKPIEHLESIFDGNSNIIKREFMKLNEEILIGNDFNLSYYEIDNKYCIFGFKFGEYYKSREININLYNKKLQKFHKTFESNFSSKKDINIFVINSIESIIINKYFTNDFIKFNEEKFRDIKFIKLESYLKLLNEEIEVKKEFDPCDKVSFCLNFSFVD